MPYTAHTPSEIKEMLDVIGVKNEDELFSPIPNEAKAKAFDIPDGLDEWTALSSFTELSKKNKVDKVCFMGGGYYDHIIPSAVDALAGRSEFYTSYTPYQAEASQGTLQSLYEYQSLVCELSGMEISNASLYDGGTALAEAALMSVRITRKNKVLIDGGVNAEYIKIIKTYLSFRDIECEVIANIKDSSDIKTLKLKIDDTVASCIFQNPNFFGSVQDWSEIVDALHAQKALAIMSVYPISLGILQDPGSLGADIVCADGQSLGNYLNFGGPSFGMLATKQEYIRNVPGRIIGKTLDKNNNDIFVLTMQAREQHIRRHRATSNICTNQNLLALRATIFLSMLGRDGLVDMANMNYQKSEYLKSQLSKIDKVSIYNNEPTFNEFIISTPKTATKLIEELNAKGFLLGVNMSKIYDGFDNEVLIATTEKRTKKDIDNLVLAIKEVL